MWRKINNWDRERLTFMVKEFALSTGEFTLASGATSSYYIDFAKVSLVSEGIAIISRAIRDVISYHAFDSIGGPTLGAAPIVSAALSNLATKRGFLVRRTLKSHGKQTERVEGPIKQGDKVLLVEDVTTSGESVLWAAQTVEKLYDAQVVGILTMVDRQAGAKEFLESRGYHFHSLLTTDDLEVK